MTGAGLWRVGFMAGLQVGQAFGVLLLPGFVVGSSSLQGPWHPVFMCNSGFNCYDYYFYRLKALQLKFWRCAVVLITIILFSNFKLEMSRSQTYRLLVFNDKIAFAFDIRCHINVPKQ